MCYVGVFVAHVLNPNALLLINMPTSSIAQSSNLSCSHSLRSNSITHIAQMLVRES